jgi:hypothetical protein
MIRDEGEMHKTVETGPLVLYVTGLRSSGALRTQIMTLQDRVRNEPILANGR